MKNLKVVKEDGFFKKGDILTYDEELDAYTLDITSGDKFRSAMLDHITADELVEKEIMVKVSSSKEIEETILSNSEVQRYMEGKPAKKVIFVPKKIINIVC